MTRKSMQLGDVCSVVNPRKRVRAKRVRPKPRKPGTGRVYASPPKLMLRYLIADHGGHGLTIPTERAFIGLGEIGTEYDFRTVLFDEILDALGGEAWHSARALAEVSRAASRELVVLVQRTLSKQEEKP